jgi:HAE1 family hydrophobic/amphiphilic exporter-1
MRITKLSINRHVTFLMIYAAIIGFGIFSLSQLKVDLYPKLEFPIIAVVSEYSGVGPFDMETVVTRPLEEAVASVANIKKITSNTSQGVSLVMLEFDWGTDMKQAELDVRKYIDLVRDYLPDGVTKPMVFAFDPSMQPVLYLALSSKVHGQAELRYIAEHSLKPRLERISGVASASIMGGMQREIKVEIDPNRLRARNLSIQQVTAALQMANLQIPSGYVDDSRNEYTIQTAGEFRSLDEIENTNIPGMGGGSAVRIKDVAKVEDGFKDVRQKIWNNQKPAVMVFIQRQSDANTVQVSREVKNQLTRIQNELPRGVKIEIMMDLSTFILRSMSNLTRTAYEAILLTFLVLLFFLRNVRSSLIVAVSIPVSLITTFIVMNRLGLTLNIISMAGLALAIGHLVDTSIVVLESVFRRREAGESLKDAAYDGTSEVGMAITASTLTILAVFAPILFVPGLAGQLFKEMVLVICFSLSISLVVSLTLVPLMSSRWLKSAKRLKDDNPFMRLSGIIGGWLDELHAFYKKALAWSLDRRKTVLWSAFGLFVVSVIVLALRGGEFMPKSDEGYMSLTVNRSPGTSLESMEKSMIQLGDVLQKNIPEAENVYSSFGQGEGIYALFSSRSSSEGDVTIRLKSLTQRKRDMFKIQDDLRPKLDKMPDFKVSFQDRGEAMFMGGADIEVKIFGYDLKQAETLSKDIEKRLLGVKGVVGTTSTVKDATPELSINLDRHRIADLGLSAAQVGQTVSTAILGSVATKFRDRGNEYDIRVQLSKDVRTSKQDVENILIATPAGAQVPLRAIATVEYSKAPKQIDREDRERITTIRVDVSGRDLRSVTSDVKKILKQVPVPRDYRIEIGGTAEELQKSFMYLGLAFLVALSLTYMVMASQFESWVDPFIIMFTIPLSIIGVALGLVITGTDLNVMALIGVIMLVGIVTNNGIVLVDCINQRRQAGSDLR